jgi:hypothetical protein
MAPFPSPFAAPFGTACGAKGTLHEKDGRELGTDWIAMHFLVGVVNGVRLNSLDWVVVNTPHLA